MATIFFFNNMQSSTIKYLTMWDQILKQYPYLFNLWTEYINFRQANFASFTFSQCINVFEECIRVLQQAAWNCALEDKDHSHSM